MDDWNSSIESSANTCGFHGNGSLIFTTECRQTKDCSLWYDQVLPTNGSTACKLVDGSSGSCCPDNLIKGSCIFSVYFSWADTRSFLDYLATFRSGIFDVKWQLNCDFFGDDIGSMRIGFEQQIRDKSGYLTEEQCGRFCAANPNCSHFRLHEENCYMKKKPITSLGTFTSNGLCGFVPWRFDSGNHTIIY
jgi:hypothetical protein